MQTKDKEGVGAHFPVVTARIMPISSHTQSLIDVGPFVVLQYLFSRGLRNMNIVQYGGIQHFLRSSKLDTFCCRSGIFQELNSNKSARLAARAAQFSFLKITGTFFGTFLIPSFYFKEQLSERKFEILFYEAPKMSNIVFDPDNL